MIPSDDTIAALREALRVSPTNVPLHKHLAESLLKLGRFEEAETAYREGLAVVAASCRTEAGPGRRLLPAAEELAGAGDHRGLARASGPARRRLHLARQAAWCAPASRSGPPTSTARASNSTPASPTRNWPASSACPAPPPVTTTTKWSTAAFASAPANSRRAVRGRHRAAQDDVPRRRRHGLGQGRDPHEDHLAAGAAGDVPGLRQESRRRHSDVRPARLRQNLSRPRHGRRGEGRLPVDRHQRRARHVDRQQRKEPARAVRAGPPQPAVRAVLRRGRRPRRQPGRHAPQRRAAPHQPVPGRAGRRRRGQRRRVDPGRHERALASRQRLPPPRPVRPHPVRAAARRAGPRLRSCG